MKAHIDSTEFTFVEGVNTFPQFTLELETVTKAELVEKLLRFQVSLFCNVFHHQKKLNIV